MTLARAAESMLAPALTILLSSFLLFLVQPIMARQILPWFGGSASVWTICLVFFQLVLLLGYTYAHWLTSRGTNPRQFAWHVVLLLLSCLALPIIAGPTWKPVHDSQPALQILGLLAATIGLPYFLLASTAPLLQKWLSEANGVSSQGHSIYRLFALSNLGSLAGLLSYPFAIEPFTSLRVQAWVWSGAYLLYVGSLVSYIWTRRLRREPRLGRAVDHPAAMAPPAVGRYGYWIGCAALGSVLLLSVTSQITQNVASIPLLWIVPLSIYLLSFVLCFEGRSGRGWYERRIWITPALLANAAMAWALSANQANLSIYLALPLYATGLLLGCMVCHGELARSKPGPAYLTNFYLSLAAGGALGGLLVGLLAPRVFTSYWELPLALLVLAGLGVYGWSQELRALPRMSWIANVLVALPATALILLLLGAVPAAFALYIPEWAKFANAEARWGCTALLLMAAAVLQRYDLSRAVVVTALLCTMMLDWGYYHSLSTGTELMVRNFYGALRVQASTAGALHIRTLAHGVTVHGSQVLEAPQSEMPTTYYGETSGIGRTLLIKHMSAAPLRIGSIGLGAGTLAVYGQSGDVFRAYELNPAVVAIAREQFSYLRDSKAQIEVALGDARLSLERELAQGKFDRPEQRFDVLSVDAFSGDAIPVHLLTREAFASYARAITPDGVIAFHLSNRYLDLAPVVKQIARDAGFQAVLVADRPSEYGLLTPSDWALVTRSQDFLRQPEIAAYSIPIVPRRGLREWTDQFSNLFQILK
jgi:SAM-dependent methyltransferase